MCSIAKLTGATALPRDVSVFGVQQDHGRWIVRGPTAERFGNSVGVLAVLPAPGHPRSRELAQSIVRANRSPCRCQRRGRPD
jgi:hypothetical protein